MDSQYSDAPTEALTETLSLIARFQEAARRGDWVSAGKIMAELKSTTLPASAAELGEYLSRLQHALAVARASRATAAGTLRRLNAVTKFNRAGANSESERQKFVDLTSY